MTTTRDAAQVDALLGDMSDAEALGQRFMVGFGGKTPSEEVLRLIGERRVGGVILFSRNIGDAREVAALTQALQGAARAAGHRAPLLISIDQENGLVRRLGPDATAFPGAMALGAISGPDAEALVAAVAEATGRELRALGVNMNLAPVADVNNNPANPVIGVRSFGADPARVARLTAAATRGYGRAGVVATLKHFPGHGDTATDSHLALPVVPYPIERLRAVELPPFAAGIAAGAPAVLTAHLALPGVTGSATLPATLAPQVARLLRGELGFGGVIITDCLEMDAIAETVGVAEGARQALLAGADIILISHRADRQQAGWDAAWAAVERGEAPRAALRAGAARTLALKRRFLTWDAALAPAALTNPDLLNTPAHQALSATVYARAVTLMRDGEAGGAGAFLPLRLEPEARLLVVATRSEAVSRAVDTPYRPEALAEALRLYHPNTDAAILPLGATASERAAFVAAVDTAEVVALVTLNARRDQAQAEALRQVAETARRLGRRVVGLAVGDPYDARVFPEVACFIATYEYTPAALTAAARILVGAQEPTGRLPVTLDYIMTDAGD